MSRPACWLLCAITAAALPCACGGDSREAQSPINYPSQCAGGHAYADGRCPPPESGGPATAPPSADAGAAGVGAGTAIPTVSTPPACVALDATAASAATQVLAPLGSQYAPEGAKPVGSLLAGQCQPGQGLEAEVMMQPGRCYTVVGVGLPPVEDLDIQLVAKLPVAGLLSPVVAEDKTEAANAAIGEKPNCFKWALPTAAPIRLLVKVERGQGVVAAQVYEK